MRVELDEAARTLAERRFTRVNGPDRYFADLPATEQDELIYLEERSTWDALPMVLRALVPDDSDFDAAAAAGLSKDWKTLSDDQRDAARAAVRPILAAYLLAPTTNGKFHLDVDYAPAVKAAHEKMKELLDRRMTDPEILADLVISEIVPYTNVGSIQTFLLQRLTDSEREARESEQRMREALVSAEADRHPCTALHLRVEELRRRVGERHGFTLIGCACCGDDMVAQDRSNTAANPTMEICSRCTYEMFMVDGEKLPTRRKERQAA